MEDNELIVKINVLLSANAEPYFEVTKEVRDFIADYFSERLEQSLNKSKDDYFDLLEKVDSSSRKLARVIILEKNRDAHDFSRSPITNDQMRFYGKSVTKALKNDVDRLLDTLSKHQYQHNVHALIVERQVIGSNKKLYQNQLPIIERLQGFSLALEACLSDMKGGSKAGTPGKKTDIFREMFIAAMTDTWVDMTGTPPKQLTVDYNQLGDSNQIYKKDEFSEFLIKGATLFGRELNLEELARDMVEHHRKTLEHYDSMYKTHLELSQKDGISPQLKEFYESKAHEFLNLSKGLMKK